MFITPMKPMSSLDDSLLNGQKPEVPGGQGGTFQQIFNNAIQDMKDTQAAVDRDTQLLATGEIDDLHTLGINTTKAYLAERLVVELRNKAIDAYSEIMRISL